ncbi:MAG TPA: hypothetical protein VL551_27600 [Actinospica sp.]|nr:hypothetical protein [Actinospica sp.]
MSHSLRFGPHPPDLELSLEPQPKDSYARAASHDFAIVRARIGGRWRLGVLREWKQIRKDGLIIRIEYGGEKNNGPVCQWFKYRAESLDPLAVNPETGAVALVPPHLRG